MDERDRELVARYFRDKLKSNERVGCPDSVILEQIAAGVLPPGSPWYDHLTTCGPCFRETEEIRNRLRANSTRRAWSGKRWLVIVLIAAAIFGVGAALFWRLA